MYDDSGPGGGSFRIVFLMIIAVIVVIGATVVLNGSTTTEEVTNDTNATIEDTGITPVNMASNEMGSVVKYSGFGNNSSEIRIAIVCGIDSDGARGNSVLATLESMSNLKYSYDLYVINATNDSINNTTGNDTNSTNSSSSSSSSNMTLNNKSETLASEYVLPDIKSNRYNFSVDIHGVSSNESNSYMFVPVEDTYTSSLVVSNISNATGVGKYLPDKYRYANSLGIPLIDDNIGSMVYVSNQYYSDGASNEISSVLSAIDNFDFLNVMSSNITSNTTDDSANNTTNTSANNTDNSVGNTEL